MNLHRRSLIGRAAGLGLAASLPPAFAANAPAPTPTHRFAPQSGDWRSFDVTTRIELPATTGATRAWVPLPSVQTGWQLPLGDSFASNGQARVVTDGAQGVRLVAVDFAGGVAKPYVEVTSRVRTQSRTLGTKRVPDDASTLRDALRPTHLLPLDGIVRETAQKATRGARGDEAKVRALYDWVVANAWREPTVKGCGGQRSMRKDKPGSPWKAAALPRPTSTPPFLRMTFWEARLPLSVVSSTRVSPTARAIGSSRARPRVA